jgi:hypothetical protein
MKKGIGKAMKKPLLLQPKKIKTDLWHVYEKNDFAACC